jgi:signal transduction histidine kinase
VKTKAGEWVWIVDRGKVFERDKTGQPVRMLGTERDITARKQAQEALRTANQLLSNRAVHLEALVEKRTARLTEMVNELQHLSYAITHDMRAPLRAMSAFSELILQKTSGASPETHDYCHRILTGARRLDKLIQDALNYTKAVLQELPLEPVNLSELLRGMIDTYPNLHANKAHIHIEGDPPSVLGNESLLTQCFSNLLENAVKFVAPGMRPDVRIWSDLHNGFVRIWIQDNGIGIPKHAQQRLFGMFQKLDTQYEGTGIGLAIVRKVVERMGGRVSVDSEVGKGTRFCVELRLAPQQVTA